MPHSQQRTTRIFLALGSNLGNKKNFLNKAISLLKEKGLCQIKCSSFYKTPPIDCPSSSPYFLNAVLYGLWSKNINQLFRLTSGIEKQLGRQRLVKNAPRNIDIDILLFGQQIIRNKDLIIPHPRMHQRRFVLEPLVEIAPNIIIPNQQYSAKELLEKLPKNINFKKI